MFASEPASHPGDHRGSALPRPGRRAPSAGVEDSSRMPPPAPRLGEENPPDGGPPLRKPAPANVSSLPQPSRVSGTRFAPTPRNRPTATTSTLDISVDEPQPHAVPPTPAVMDVSLPDPLSETQPMGTTPNTFRSHTTSNHSTNYAVPPPMPPVHSDATQTSDPYVTRLHPQHHHSLHSSVPSYRIGSQRTTSPGRIIPQMASSSPSPSYKPVSHQHATTRRQPPPTAASSFSVSTNSLGNSGHVPSRRSPRTVIGGGDGTAVGQTRRSRSPHINVVPSAAPPKDQQHRRQTTPPASSSSSVRPPFPGWDAPVDPTIHHVVHQPQPTNLALVHEAHDDDNDSPHQFNDNDYVEHQSNYNRNNESDKNINSSNQAYRSEPIFVNPIDERFSVHGSPIMGGGRGGRGHNNNNVNEPFGDEDSKSPSVSAIKNQPHQSHTLAGGGRGPGGPGRSSASPVSPSATRQLHFNSQSPSSAVGSNTDNNRGGSADSSRFPYGTGSASAAGVHSTTAETTPVYHQVQSQPQRGGRNNIIPSTAPNYIQPGEGLKRVPSGGVRTYKVPSRRTSNATNNNAPAASTTNPRQLNGFTLHSSATTNGNDATSNRVEAPRYADGSAARQQVVASVADNNSMGASVVSRRSHSSIVSARSKSFSPTHRSASLASLHQSPNGGGNNNKSDTNDDNEDAGSASSSISDVDRPHVHTRWAPPAGEIMLSVCESASDDDDIPALTVLGREASPQYKASPQVLGMNVSRSQSVRSTSPMQQHRPRSRAGSISSQASSPHHHHIGYYMPKEETSGMRQRAVPTYVDPALRETFMRAVGGPTTASGTGVGGARSMGQGRGPGGATPRDGAYRWKDGIDTSRISPQRSSASPPPPTPPPQSQPTEVRASSEPKRDATPEHASPPHIKPTEPILTEPSSPITEIVAPEPEVTSATNDDTAVTAPPSPAKEPTSPAKEPTSPLPYYGRNDSPVDPTDVPKSVTFGKVQVREVYPYLINGMTEKQYKHLMLTNMNAINESKAPKVKQGCCS